MEQFKVRKDEGTSQRKHEKMKKRDVLIKKEENLTAVKYIAANRFTLSPFFIIKAKKFIEN